MTSFPREYIASEPFTSFHSCGLAPYHKLSNFAYILQGITYDGITYPSTEHAYQAQTYIAEHRPRFSVSGDLGAVDSGFQLVYSGKDWEKKRDFWMKKGNIGIIAKMATNKKNTKSLGLVKDTAFQHQDERWFTLLRLKFDLPEFKDILLATEHTYLLEFDRRAKRNIPFWAGIIDNEVLYGNNAMGKYIMAIRDQIQEQPLDSSIAKKTEDNSQG